MTDVVIDLAILPEPTVIEPLDYEADLRRRKDKLIDLDEALPVEEQNNIREFIDLESELSVKILEEATYAEMILRNRINQAYRARLLYFATGADLDHVAEEYGVERLVDEPDEDFRERVRISNRGSSSAGPDDWWRKHALAAHEQVEDVSVDRVEIGPDNEERGFIRVAVLADTDDGIPSEEILTDVRNKLTADDVRGVCVKVEVVAATSLVFDVTAKIWTFENAASDTFDNLEAQLRAAVAENRALNWDVTTSWITTQLHQSGVYLVELEAPTGTVTANKMQTPVIGTVTLTHEGTNE